MKTIKHKFANHKINPNTEYLIIGTFNPDAEKNPADFFYGRNRNYLWRLITSAFNIEDLKGKSKAEKLDFINKYKIDFIDLIAEVNVEEGKEIIYDDAYIDNKVSKWNNVISEIKILKDIKKVCFTRKTFSDVPFMKTEIEKINKFCEENKIHFEYLPTPARFYRQDKQDIWTNFFIA
jgi:G:T/U-mismatch repair DNA glycosylase